MHMHDDYHMPSDPLACLHVDKLSIRSRGVGLLVTFVVHPELACMETLMIISKQVSSITPRCPSYTNGRRVHLRDDPHRYSKLICTSPRHSTHELCSEAITMQISTKNYYYARHAAHAVCINLRRIPSLCEE